MKHQRWSFGIFALCVCSNVVAQTYKIEPNFAESASEPDREVCHAIAESWQAILEGNAAWRGERQTLEWLGLTQRLPKLQQFSEGEMDLNGDGVLEAYDLDYTFRSSGHAVHAIYRFETIEQYKQVLAARPENDRHLRLSNNADRFTPSPQLIMGYSLDLVAFIYGGILYGTHLPEGKHEQIGIARYDGEETTYPCSIRLLPNESNLPAAIVESPWFQALERMHGGPERGGICYGMRGWRWEAPKSTLNKLMQPTTNVFEEAYSQEPSRNRLRSEFHLLSWGVKDPSSWRVYSSFMEHRPDFVARLTAYFEARGLSRSRSKDKAQFVYHKLVGTTFYHGDWIDQSLFADLTTNDLDKISAEAFAGWVANGWLQLEQDSEQMTRIALLASIYANVDEHISGNLWAEMREFIEKSNNSRARLYPTAELIRKELHVEVLSAAAFYPSRIELLIDLGAQVNAQANAFGKTALMYAAQHNRREAVTKLLHFGADPNLVTKSTGRTCVELERDNRTALMYAAETAEHALIRLLIDAGADGKAQDSQGNDVLWYLNKNVLLSEEEHIHLKALVQGQTLELEAD